MEKAKQWGYLCVDFLNKLIIVFIPKENGNNRDKKKEK